mgnify:FL=1
MSNSISSGQVLQSPYTAEKAKIIVREMVDRLVLDLVNKGVVTNQLVLTIGYDKESLTNPEVRYTGEVVRDAYGREIPKHAHGTANLEGHSSSSKEFVEAVLQLYDRIVNQELLVRRVTIAACHVIAQDAVKKEPKQLDLFTDAEESEKQRKKAEARRKEKQLQKAILQIQKKYGKNAVLKGTNLLEGATMKERNNQVGGHRA